jgi:hypothetical protein
MRLKDRAEAMIGCFLAASVLPSCFCWFLGARKRVPTWRIGRAQVWMRGHLWLGFLALPMILFHGGFHFGGTLTRVLMWLLIITVLSGVFGAVLQHYLPRAMTSDVPLETIYDEIAHVRSLLREEADRAVESICGSLGLSNASREEGQRAGGFTALRTMAASAVPLRTSAAVSAGASAAVAAAPEIILLSEESAPLRRFYLKRCGHSREAETARPAPRRCRKRPARSRIAKVARCRTCAPDDFQTSATRRASSGAKSGCTTGCMIGCFFTFHFRWH